MLVFADGSQAGTLGGGCVEAEVKRRALTVLAGGVAEICSFQLDSDYGWDDGLICGGRMQVLVEPVTPGSDTTYFTRLRDELVRGQGCVEAIVFDAAKSGLAATACYLLDASGQLLVTRHASPADGPLPAVGAAGLWPKMRDPVRPQATSGVAYLPTGPAADW